MGKSKSVASEKPQYDADDTIAVGEVLNASGHKQELERQFSLLSICSIGITTGNVWAALGGSIVCFFLIFTDGISPSNSYLLSCCFHARIVITTRPANNDPQVIALYNGGPPGVIYEFIAVSCFYFMIAACIAEMASSIPSAAGVYHWASVTGGAKFGRVIGYFAGWYVHHPMDEQQL